MQERRPQAVMISKRANVFYLEHVRIMQKDDRVVYLSEGQDGIDKFVSIPDKNTAFVLLGKGTSITDAAVRKLAESNVLVGFCGSGGSPLFAEIDLTFLLPQDEYRPPQHAQAWYAMWADDVSRLGAGKAFLSFRSSWDKEMFAKQGINIPDALFSDFEQQVARCESTTDLLTTEGRFAKHLYALLAQQFGVNKFNRNPGAKKKETVDQVVNSFLDHGNYLAYGYAAVALHGMGIPYFLPVLHGKTRRGALVFDVADLFKDWLVMPKAFACGAEGKKDRFFRAQIIEGALKNQILDEVMGFISSLPQKVQVKQ